MFHHVFSFIKNRLLEYVEGTGSAEEAVNFVDLNSDPPAFKSNVNILLINIAGENHVGLPDPYLRINEQGQKVKVKPPLQLIVDVLFAVKPNGGQASSRDFNYLISLGYLSRVVEYFQANPIFPRTVFPDLPAGLDRLVVEFHPLNYSQQNEVWSALKTAYLPSVCFRLKMLTFQSEPAGPEKEVKEIKQQIHGA